VRESNRQRFVANEGAWRMAVSVAVVSGLFSLIVCVLLIANYLLIRATDPLNSPELLALRQQLVDAPATDDTLVQQIRALDLLARKAFFTSQAHLRYGGQLLLGGVVVLLIALKLAGRWRPKIPTPEGQIEATEYWGSIAQSKQFIAFAGAALVVASLLAAYLAASEIPLAPRQPGPNVESQAAVAEDAPPAADEVFPTWETMQKNWPSFRGPGGFGVAHYTTAPTDWDGASGRGIRWTAKAPLPGFGSPVVWDDRLFLSGATEDVREVYCYDADTGELVWQKALDPFPGTPPGPPKVSEDTGYAAPTMAVHGTRAFAIFANGDLACFDRDGRLLWGRGLGMPDNHYGHASSLIAYQNLLFVQYDHNTEAKLLALDVVTGEQAWVAAREKISWASPACVPTAFGFQLILNSESNVDAYDPPTGRLLWSEQCLDGEVAPSPAYASGIVFSANDYAVAAAIRLSGADGAVQSEVVWEWEDSLPDVSSPVGSDRHFYIATSMGEIVCLDVQTGAKVWTEEFDDGFYASPIVVGDRIYAADREGTTQIFTTGPAFERIGSPALHEPISATPAFLDGRIYVRTAEHLVCIERQDGQPS